MEESSSNMAPVVPQQEYESNVDYVISDYMDRLGTRLNILETELKYAWRALDLLSQEYIKMWERLEKLESLLYEQQSVITQLLDFYTSGGGTRPDDMGTGPEGSALDGHLGELEVIREILGNGTIEDGLEEGVDVTRASQPIMAKALNLDIDEMHIPDEAFYMSLNQAYRDDLVGCDAKQATQLGMIWEEREEGDEEDKKEEMRALVEDMRLEETQEVYSAMDYKDYRGDSPCVSEQDLAQLSRISSIDHVAIEKLNELDRLSTKLQQDSINIKQLQKKLLESPRANATINLSEDDSDKSALIEEQLREAYNDTDNWSFSSCIHEQKDLLVLNKSEIPNSLTNSFSNRSSSRLSVSDSVMGTDNEVAEALAGTIRTPTSPRRRQIDIVTCSAPYTTVTGRLAYSAAVQNLETTASKNPFTTKNPFYNINEYGDLDILIKSSYDKVSCVSPLNVSVDMTKSPTMSLYGSSARHDAPCLVNKGNTMSPPPPAPKDDCEFLSILSASVDNQKGSSPVFLSTVDNTPHTSINGHEQGRYSPKTPHSPRSPKCSPKRSKSHSSNIVTVKSDSGLSSMSGWSSLEKSPGSPKNGLCKNQHNYYTDVNYTRPYHIRSSSPIVTQIQDTNKSRSYIESEVDYIESSNEAPPVNPILPGGHHLSAFTTVKSPSSFENTNGYGTFVPAPAPASDINVSPRRNPKHSHNAPTTDGFIDFMYRNDQPAIYSVAGSNRQESYTSVYTSNSADYINQTARYPDLIEPYKNNELTSSHIMSNSQINAYNSMMVAEISELQPDHIKRLNRSYSVTGNPDGPTYHEGYKTAMQRTMFPTGNITDALTYYPTSTRYDTAIYNLPNADYNDPINWLGDNHYVPDNTSTSSSLRSMETESCYSQSPYAERRTPQKQQEQRFIIQQSLNDANINRNWNQRPEIPHLELDLRNRNVPEYVVQQHRGEFYDSTGVIVSQSGYITISSDIGQDAVQKSKKIKRGNTLKSAMNSMTHWFPDLHLTKRSRSYSLPGNRPNEIQEKTKTHVKPSGNKKKKRSTLVSTVSGILQKAKRKSHGNQSHSMSDPEQSENEWSGRERCVASEDDRSEDNCSVFSEILGYEHENLFEKVVTSKKKTECIQQTSDSSMVFNDISEFDVANQSYAKQMVDIEDNTEVEINVPPERQSDEEKNKSSSTGLFATVGDAKRCVHLEKTEDGEDSDSKFPTVSLGGASMEFAVSRALGKYRQRQTTLSEDHYNEHSDDLKVEQDFVEKHAEKSTPSQERISNEFHPNDKMNTNEDQAIEGSPAAHIRGHLSKFLPRHQQSLEIPGMRNDDDDNRSTHSWRSGSRVSSRRQSTEDSIDSEDEWYCYELKKLEEMERQTQLEVEFGEPLEEVPELEDTYEPDEEVKEKMSFVLRELRMKAKVVKDVLEEKDNARHVLASAKYRESKRANHCENTFSNYDFPKIAEENECVLEDILEEAVEEPKSTGHSSGETSGPDSPQLSIDEYEEAELAEEFARCQSERNDSFEYHHQNEFELDKDSSGLPKIHIEISDIQDNAKDTGPLGSKWKLLKALKERKAEEKSNQDKIAETASEKDKVSMMGMVQKFYEIHVKT